MKIINKLKSKEIKELFENTMYDVNVPDTMKGLVRVIKIDEALKDYAEILKKEMEFKKEEYKNKALNSMFKD